ncbi:MAG: hypothetical protein ABI616_07180 [Pseudomonadota bacterium]
MSAIATDFRRAFDDRLTSFEWAFVQAVLEHRGVHRDPTGEQFRGALDVLRRYDEQCADNPGGGIWQPQVSDTALAELSAMAFVMFGATKPTPAQWHKAHAALYGPLLCETCG